MTPETARNTFDRALRDELAGHERAEFETALENDAALCAEFEAYSDSRGGADLRAIDQWLRGAGAEAARQRPMIQPGLAESVALAAQGRRRGRLIRVAFGVAAVAAAAAIALIVMFPTQSSNEGPVYGWPNPHVGQVVMLSDSARHFEKALEFAPTPGVKIEAGSGSLLRPTLEGLEVIDGEVRATLESGATYEMRVANHRVSATGPAEFSANVRAEGFGPMPRQGARPGLLARFGGMGFELTVTAAKGQAAVKAGETETVIAEGKSQTFKGEDERKPPKPEELFEELDSDSDGKLTEEEAAERMIKDFDENKDGSVSLDEFKAKWRPGPPPHRVEERFRQLDRNKDGKLDDVEVEQRMIDDFDDDNSGAVELPEFRRHFRPPPEGPRPPREGGPGPEGQRPPREGGPGPEGQRPPRGPGPGPDGPRPPRGPGPK